MTEKKEEMSDKYSYLIENGSRLIRENQFEKVLDLVRELPSEKRVDFKIRVIENFAYLKGFLVNKNREYGQKWKVDRRAIVYTGDKTATLILIDLLKDEHAHFRIYTLRALAYLGDQRALEPLQSLSNLDPNEKVRGTAKKAYIAIGGKSPVQGSLKEEE